MVKKGKIVQGKDFTYYYPEDFEMCLFNELKFFVDFDSHKYRFVIPNSKKAGVLAIIKFYESENAKTTTGQRKLFDKIQNKCNNKDLVIVRKDDGFYIIDANNLSGSMEELQKDLSKMGIKNTEILTNVRMKMVLNFETSNTTTNKIENKPLKKSNMENAILLENNFAKEKDIYQTLVKDAAGADVSLKETNDTNEIIFSTTVPENVVKVNYCASYVRISYWKKKQYMNKIQLNYNKQYDREEIVKRLGGLLRK